jgi:Family of unknown function (DUF6982)
MISTGDRFIAHFTDGSVAKGFTQDLVPGNPTFHLVLADTGERRQILLQDLKAVFAVKSFDGDSERQDVQEGERPGYGKKIRVVFKDGEEIVGYTNGYAPERPAFFLFPVDAESNNARILVVNRFVEQAAFV